MDINNAYTERITTLSTDEILEEIEKLDTKRSGNSFSLNLKAVDTIRKKFIETDDSSYSFPQDGSVECILSADLMSVKLSFYPATSGMALITLETVKSELEKVHVSYGINWDLIEESILRCNMEHVAIFGVKVAQGKLPTPEIPEHYLIDESTLTKSAPKITEEGNIDYKTISPYILVKAGDKIGTIVPYQKGINGTNVQGEEISFNRLNVPSLTLGSNIDTIDGALISKIDGILEQKGQTVSVHEVLIIQTNVDYHTGNIDFTGDVILLGDVQEGFTIKAGGSVFAEQTIDTTILDCIGDLHVKRGIIGRKEGKIKVGGEIHAKFAENCLIEAGGKVDITTSIIRTSIYTGDSIQCGQKSVVIGGTFFAQNGFRAYQIGNMTAPKTEIYCGLDFKILKNLEWNKEQSLTLALALQKIKKQLVDTTLKTEKIMLLEKRDRIKEAIKKLNLMSQNLVFDLDKNEQAVVEVIDKIYPGVYIQICHVSYVVKKPMTSIRFKLDKKTGTITPERLT